MSKPGEISEDLAAYVPVNVDAFERLRSDLAKAKGDVNRQFLLLKFATDNKMPKSDIAVAQLTWKSAEPTEGADAVDVALGPDWAARRKKALAAEAERDAEAKSAAERAPKLSALDRMADMAKSRARG